MASVRQRQTTVEPSSRTIEPLGTRASRPLTISAAALALFLALVMTALRRHDIDELWLMALALTILAASCVLLVLASRTSLPGISGRQHFLIAGLACVATFLAAMSQWRSNEFLRDDWGHLALGVVLVAMSPYRPTRYLVLAGTVCGSFVAGLALYQSVYFATPLSPITFAIVAAIPVVALSLAGAAYAHAATQSRARWRAAALRFGKGDEGEASPTMLAKPQRVRLLNGEVMPLLERILNRDSISAPDASDAASVAAIARSIMVAEANRTWLDAVIAAHAANFLVAGREGIRKSAVRDDARLSDAMDFQQRTAIRALLGAIFTHPEFLASRFSAAVAVLPGGHKRLLIEAIFGTPERANSSLKQWPFGPSLRWSVQRAIGHLLTVTQRAFPWQDVIMDSSGSALKLTLRFSYGH
ncbi:hypothetical protein B0I08_11230 [Glaciihabitans tibetensis]|uniref:Uncharacterized protein n=2 Tax=Glaciihabitans tibetensis TaxID=1266600 RepID=A0A2T0V391_9MICO|nr:hypothetical protein B0I08_11230 [Glaciihabitans tibetensis]